MLIYMEGREGNEYSERRLIMLNKTNDLTLKEVITGIIQHKKLVISTTMIGLLTGIIISGLLMFYYSVNNEYYAQVSMVVNAKTASGEYAAGKNDTPDVEDINLSESLAPSSEFLARSERIYNMVKKNLNLDMNYKDFKNAIQIEQFDDTQILQLTVTLKNGENAVSIANEITKVLPDALQETMEIGSVNVIDNSLKSSPLHYGFQLLYPVIGFVVAFLAALAWSVLHTAAYPRIQTNEDIEELLGLEVLAEIPHMSSIDKQAYLNITSENISLPFTENYGILTAITQVEMKKHKASSLMITSSIESEGKSTVVVNLGQALAAMGKKVLIMDCDIRKPTIGKAFALTKQATRTLNSVVNGMISIEDAVINVNDNLFVLQCLTSRKMILNKKLSNLINLYKDNFDYILIDTPPIGIISDAFQLNDCTDAVLLVVKQSFTNQKIAMTAAKLLSKSGIPVIGAVMNDAKMPKYQNLYYKKYYHRSYLNTDSHKEYKNDKVKG